MHATELVRFGPPENLVLGERTEPVPGPGQIRIRIEFAAVNRSDLLLRAGRYHTLPPLPAVPGNEGAGVVDAIGPDVTDLVVGDRVVAWGPGGYYADSAIADAMKAVRIPDSVPTATAAGLPVAWLTAHAAVHTLGRTGPDDTVLVHAAVSGVGSAAVQLAARTGATVIGVVGGAMKVPLARELGANVVLDRHVDDVADAVRRATSGRGADVVLDLVGGDTFAQALHLAAPGGRVIAVANVAQQPSTIDTRDFYPRNITIHGFQFTHRQSLGWDPRPDLKVLLGDLAEGRYVVPIDSTFPLADAAGAHRRLETGQTQGKVLLDVTAG